MKNIETTAVESQPLNSGSRLSPVEVKYLADVRSSDSKRYNCHSCNDEGCQTCLGGAPGYRR
jgi:hypothetical protein